MYEEKRFENNKNLYSHLNINNFASIQDIKQAFRRLSLKYHPDKRINCNISNDFTIISNAYKILSDPTQKEEYDIQLSNQINRKCLQGKKTHDFQDQSNFLNKLSLSGENNNMYLDNYNQTNVDNLSNLSNLSNFSNFLNINKKPENIFKILEVTLNQIYLGSVVPLSIDKWEIYNGIKKEEKETIYITISKGIDNNEILIIENKGNIINDNRGDVKVQIKVIKDKIFSRKGLDLIYNKEITLKESLCGFQFSFTHLDGKIYKINNVAGPIFKDNQEKVISKMGFSREDYIGNLIIVFKIIYPEKLTKEQHKVLSEIL